MHTVHFFFDFSSAYSYVAQAQLEPALERINAHAKWRPIVLGAVFQANGWTPVKTGTPKGDYTYRDVTRSARQIGLPFKLPTPFPFNGITASRLFYALDEDNPDMAIKFSNKVFNAIYSGQDINQDGALAALLEASNQDPVELFNKAQSTHIKDRLKRETEQAMHLGVFGTPSFVADGELFWGADRIPQLCDWIERGGW